MIFAGIVAGGTGTRMGADKPKQFLSLGEKPIIICTIEKFLNFTPSINKIYIGVHPDWTDYCEKLIEQHNLDKSRISIVCGGSDRNSTVFNIIDNIILENGKSDNDIILTHDAVRPFVSDIIINDNINSAQQYGACGTYIPAIDTIICSADGQVVTSVPSRSEMYQAQTPQSFNIKKLLDTYTSLSSSEKTQLTDTCSVFTVKGLPVHIVKGEATNMKITTIKDYEIAKAIAKSEN